MILNATPAAGAAKRNWTSYRVTGTPSGTITFRGVLPNGMTLTLVVSFAGGQAQVVGGQIEAVVNGVRVVRPVAGSPPPITALGVTYAGDHFTVPNSAGLPVNGVRGAGAFTPQYPDPSATRADVSVRFEDARGTRVYDQTVTLTRI